MHILDLQTLTKFLSFKAETLKQIDEISLEDTDLNLFSDPCFKELCDALSQCNALKTLNFKGSLYKLSAAHLLALIQALSACQKLQEIILEGNQIGKWDNGSLKILGEGLLNIQGLKTLHLGYNEFDSLNAAGFKVFFDPLARSSVENLDLVGNGLGKLELPCLSTFGWALIKFKQLHIISLDQNRLISLEDEYFQILRASKTLCEIEGIQGFTALHLQELNDILSSNEQRIINTEVQSLPPQVKTLIFSYCYDPLPGAISHFPPAKRLKTVPF